jgi:hypothetical protein
MEIPYFKICLNIRYLIQKIDEKQNIAKKCYYQRNQKLLTKVKRMILLITICSNSQKHAIFNLHNLLPSFRGEKSQDP